jgi:hypothetical protein
MPISILLHVTGEDAVVVEVDELPGPTDTWIKGYNPRRKDGKDLHYLMPEVTQVLYPTWRINFIEVMTGEEQEEIITAVRDNRSQRH